MTLALQQLHFPINKKNIKQTIRNVHPKLQKQIQYNNQNIVIIIIKNRQYLKQRLTKTMRNLFKTYDIDQMIETVSECKILPLKYLKRLCQKAKEILKKQENVVHVSAPVKICGDIHGQFPDLLELFKLGGDVNNNKYLFLGDYIDRGHYSVETISYLLALKVKYPQNITLLRGNHQSRSTTKDYGFYDQCSQKYGDIAAYNAFMEVFDYLPLVAVVSNKFMCMHGGLSPHISSIDEINTFNRVQEVPMQGPITDLLWSDPSPTPGFRPNNQRMVGHFFGPDSTNKFIHQNQLRCITRAHEVAMTGYQLDHQQRVMTIFSAPNYCYRCGNKGAFLEMGQNYNGRFVVFGQVSEQFTDQQPRKHVPRHFT